MHKALRLLAILLVLLVCVGCDQATKGLARETLPSRAPINVFGGLLQLQYAENPGAFLSLGAGLPPVARRLLLVVPVVPILAAALFYIMRFSALRTSEWLGLALLAGGGLGNLVDRIFRGGMVVDFAILRVGPLHTGVFNVADLAIVAGLLLFALGALRAPRASPVH